MEKKITDLAIIEYSEASLVEHNSLNAAQLQILLKPTPPQYVHTRPAKGGGTWEYVTGGYVRKCLNLLFGWDWSFEILDEKILDGEVIVKGKLTCNSGGKSIVKTQYGNKDIAYKKEPVNGVRIALSIGNDMKAAATDCLKKCAAEIGLAADIYNKEDFRPVQVLDPEDAHKEISELFELKKENLEPEVRENAERIINEKEFKSYHKLNKILKAA